MNINQIVNMILRMIMRRALNSGIKAGLNQASKLGRKGKRPQQVQTPDDHQDQNPSQG